TGIGRATASLLHAHGAHVVVSARNASALHEFVAEHPGAIALPLDVTDAVAVQSAALNLQARGRVDCVVYCAGHYRAMNATAIDLPDMLKHNSINYLGALHVLAALVPILQSQAVSKMGQRGHISLIGSVAGYRGLPQSLAYGPTKAAIANLAETLYLDMRPSQISVSLINPGFVDTPLTQQNAFKMPALMRTDDAARAMLQGWAKGAFEIHFPKKFTCWMKVLRILPNRLFFALAGRLKQA
ncbi:MAG TPA: SDR family NAD(P)-dependent oxidoreductase, partial [Burkholderiaceae bacterium]|nr:SDR family NAD(P)-dependent oxidoreductase [Burkholderiaceae bacterium]